MVVLLVEKLFDDWADNLGRGAASDVGKRRQSLSICRAEPHVDLSSIHCRHRLYLS